MKRAFYLPPSRSRNEIRFSTKFPLHSQNGQMLCLKQYGASAYPKPLCDFTLSKDTSCLFRRKKIAICSWFLSNVVMHPVEFSTTDPLILGYRQISTMVLFSPIKQISSVRICSVQGSLVRWSSEMKYRSPFIFRITFTCWKFEYVPVFRRHKTIRRISKRIFGGPPWQRWDKSY
jgi:hypothetical protein